MDDSHHRPRGAPTARRRLALASAALLLTGCSTGGASGPAASRAPAGQAPSGSSPAAATSRWPAVPSTGDPAELGRQLQRAERTVRDRHAPASAVRRAGELEQLAVGALVTASPSLEHQVTRRLDHGTAGVVEAQVRAGRLLQAMTPAQPKLPKWRIVAPRPPGVLLGYYRAAQRRTGVPWTYLAAINLVESRMGRIRGASPAGAHGPMQFIASTWALYGAGGDVDDPHDAILAAARLLADNGAPGDMAEALRHFNPSDRYVAAVTAYARTLQRWPRAYLGYWQWRVLYRQAHGLYVLPLGYPRVRPVPLTGR